MRPGRVAMVAVGSVLALVGFALLAAGAVLGFAFATQRDDGFFHTPTGRYATDSYALASEQFDIVDVEELPSFVTTGDFGRTRLRAAPADDRAVFVGIGPRADVDRYLRDVEHAQVRDVRFRPFEVDYVERSGGAPASRPDAQRFWAASTAGAGAQELQWDLASGEWTVVVMNADATAGVEVDLEAGVRLDVVGFAAAALAVVGLVLVAFGVPLLVAGAVTLAEHGPPAPPTAPIADPEEPDPVAPPGAAASALFGPREIRPYPARLTGEPPERLSRWLWLVKWILVLPHVVVLAVLWLAFLVLTPIAGVAILATGRYPAGLFEFNVGVLRWTWRVGFYSYSALGTDRYPPFTLARTDHPADFDVDRPETLSRALVLVKWWLLALPHLLVVSVLGSAWGLDVAAADLVDPQRWPPGGLIGILVLVAGVVLLVRGRYPSGLFDLVVGLNRWVFRVLTYVALLRDEYPPFRLDQGPREPRPRLVVPSPPPSSGEVAPTGAGAGDAGSGDAGSVDAGPGTQRSS